VATRSREWVCGRSFGDSRFECECRALLRRVLYKPIPRLEESYQVCVCVCVCVCVSLSVIMCNDEPLHPRQVGSGQAKERRKEEAKKERKT